MMIDHGQPFSTIAVILILFSAVVLPWSPWLTMVSHNIDIVIFMVFDG